MALIPSLGAHPVCVSYIGRRYLAGLIFLEENDVFTRQRCWRDGTWKTDHHQNTVFRDKGDLPGFLVEDGSDLRRRLRMGGISVNLSAAGIYSAIPGSVLDNFGKSPTM